MAQWLISPRLSIPIIRLLLLITGSLRICSAYHLGEVIVIAAAMDAWCHHLARRDAAGIKVFLGQPFAHDVAVGHHADQAIILANPNGANVMLTHHFASSVTGASELTQSTPLCIASLTFIAELRCSNGPPRDQVYNGSSRVARPL